MSIYYEYKEFVILPTEPDFITSREQRLNTKSIDESKNINVIKKSLFEQYGDRFEAMEINDFGDVILWTNNKVWCIHKSEKLEKLLYLPRNPNDFR